MLHPTWFVIQANCIKRRCTDRDGYFNACLRPSQSRRQQNREDDSAAAYSIALPDLQQFRNLWARLPTLAKERTQISVLFVTRDGSVDKVTE